MRSRYLSMADDFVSSEYSPCTELIVRIMARWSQVFTPRKKNVPMKNMAPLFHPHIIDDILSGILFFQEQIKKSEKPPQCLLRSDNIPSYLNYEKVISQSEEEDTSNEESTTKPLLKAVFHKDWNHMADILLHQYEQYLSLLSKMAVIRGDIDFFPTVMYPDLIHEKSRITSFETKIFVLSLTTSSWLIPKSHLFFYRQEKLMKIPLTFSACMRAYFEESDNLCPKWSMEKVCYDVLYDEEKFIRHVHFIQQPDESNHCGICSLNNITQSETFVSKIPSGKGKPRVLRGQTKDNWKKGRQMCITRLSKDFLVGQDAALIAEGGGALHDDVGGTAFFILEEALAISGFKSSHPNDKSVAKEFHEEVGKSLGILKDNEGWIFEQILSTTKENELTHIVAVRRISSTHYLFLDSENPAPIICDIITLARLAYSGFKLGNILHVHDLIPLPGFDEENTSSLMTTNKMKRKVFVSPECLTSDQFWARQKVAESESESSEGNDSKNSDSDGDEEEDPQHGAVLAEVEAEDDSSIVRATKSVLSSTRKRSQTASFAPCYTKPQSPKKHKKVKVAQSSLPLSDDDESKNSGEGSPPAINLTSLRLDSLPQNKLLTYAFLNQMIENCQGIRLKFSDDKELSMVVEVMCQTKDISEENEETIGLLSQIPFVHLIFTGIPRIPLDVEVKKLDRQRILTVYKVTTGKESNQDTCCMTYDSFEEYCLKRDPKSQTANMALINLRQPHQQKTVSNTSNFSIDWRVDKLGTDDIMIDINKEILYCPDENSQETMRPLQIRSLMAKLPSYLRKTLPQQEYCMSKEVCLFESLLTFASKFEDITS